MFLNKKKVILVISISSLIFFLIFNQVKPQDLRVVDGDTIHLNGEKIRFTGIDTPELKQTCIKEGVINPCGVTAKEILIEKISMKPYKIIPLHIKDGDFKQVLTWSEEERIYKNGSYEKFDLMEQFVLDNNGKVKNFKQWKAIDSVNYGMSNGGKYFGKEKISIQGNLSFFLTEMRQK